MRRLRLSALVLLAICSHASSAPRAQAQQQVDIVAWFEQARKTSGEGRARKTRLVDVRAAKPGEIIVTIIKGEGKETQSPPAQPGDMVVRNRCAATGNEEILVKAATFPKRYGGPLKSRTADGWRPHRPKGVTMRFVYVGANENPFTFDAPWGEKMVARPGDAIVQDMRNPKDTYRIARAAFDCTYAVIRAPRSAGAGGGAR